MKKLIPFLLIALLSCNKEQQPVCKTIDRIIGNGGIYSLHFTDGTSYLNLLDRTPYSVGDQFCDIDSEFIYAELIN